jgi:raffinose/stachyose/melibiose transport system substrate-binding protein
MLALRLQRKRRRGAAAGGAGREVKGGAPREAGDDVSNRLVFAGRRTLMGRRAAVVLAVMLVLGMAGVSASADDAAKKVTLRFTDFQGGNDGILAAYKELISIFEKENPGYRVEYQQYTVTTYNEFLKPALAGGQAPDLFAVYPGPDAIEVVQSGGLLNLKPLIDAEWKKWLGPAYRFKGTNMMGGIYLTPQDIWTEGMWYHKDLLKKMGVAPKRSTEAYTVDELIKMVGPAKANGFDVVLAGFIETWCYYDAFYNFVHQQQASETPDMVEQAMNGEISWQQDIFRSSIDVFQRLNSAGVWRPDALNMDYQVQAFGKWLEKGSVFMWAQGDWFAGSMKKEDNNLQNPSIGITQYPSVSPKSVVSFNKNFGTDIGVYAKGANQKVAVKFARLTNSPRAAQIFIRNGVNPAAGVDPLNIPKTENPVFNDCIALYNSPGRYSEVYYFNPQAVKALGDGIGSVVLGTDKIDNVLAGLDKITKK